MSPQFLHALQVRPGPLMCNVRARGGIFSREHTATEQNLERVARTRMIRRVITRVDANQQAFIAAAYATSKFNSALYAIASV